MIGSLNMSLSKHAIIIFSKDLAHQAPDQQRKAVRALWVYVNNHNQVGGGKKKRKLKQEFADHFSGRIEDYSQYAHAYGILFQPEVFRGVISNKHKKRIMALGFDVVPQI